ncbi:hypothetical protein EJ04DRAFT_594089 [Polyplosphaeria fusca]|uniref:CCHC-type domain-containing protein n=1 Tax=Polyplosphaeria fusca TaxID=682080 RepID=A0A9P4R654_9PLEO|nr:hypothetical protein EJ04DRAFT_594089 [Polyplosphaeria fusca]
MGRYKGGHGNAIGSNPYPQPKDVKSCFTTCEVCDRSLMSKDWVPHKNSKKHRALEQAEKDKENGKTVGAGINESNAWGDGGNDTAQTWGDGGNDTAQAWGDGGADNGGTTDNAFGNGADTGDKKFGGACYGCGQEGHSKRNCPNSSGGQGCFNCAKPRGACYNCGETGHNKTDCPKPRQGGAGGGGSGGQCFNCYEYGHRKGECTNERVFKCRNCEEIGHLSRECPKPTDWSKVQCRNCQNYGHTVKRCPEPVIEDLGTGYGGGGFDSGAAGGVEASGDWATSGGINDNVAIAATGDWAVEGAAW